MLKSPFISVGSIPCLPSGKFGIRLLLHSTFVLLCLEHQCFLTLGALHCLLFALGSGLLGFRRVWVGDHASDVCSSTV